MADNTFTPDARYEHMLELLDRAMRGDKELQAQIRARGGFTQEELAPIQAYANRKWAARNSASAADPKKLQELQAAGATKQQMDEYTANLAKPVDVGAPYAMFLRNAEPTPVEMPAEAVTAPAPTPKKPAAPKKAPRAKIKADTSEQKVGAGLLEMLHGLADGTIKYTPAVAQQADAPTPAPGTKYDRVPMPYTVIDPYGRPIERPEQQLPPTDDPEEIQRRIEEGNLKRALLQESYKRSMQAK